MGRKEKQIELIDILKELKEKYNVVAVKAEFEAEGSRKDELIMLREMIYHSQLDFIIKIGGCEALRDIDQCKLLDATGIMAPMIESPFAMCKFFGAAQKIYGNDIKSVNWIINAETKNCMEKIDEILNTTDEFLSGVTVGRSDLCASFGLSKDKIEDDVVFNATKYMLNKSNEHKLISNFGGNIGIESIPFIMKLKGIADRFETRKIVISMNQNSDNLKDAITRALEFEYKYLIFKKNYYSQMAGEDDARLERLKAQINC